MNLIPDLDWMTVVVNLRDLALAYIIALPLAWDQETRARSAGLRTFPLVALVVMAVTFLTFRLLSRVKEEVSPEPEE